MLHDKSIEYLASVDYTDSSKLDVLVKSIIAHTPTNEILENIYYDARTNENRMIPENRVMKKNLKGFTLNSCQFKGKKIYFFV